tara:strand:- start:586 stop:705 length:120 start_codon:yes stop_codon:yes gene_type:complete
MDNPQTARGRKRLDTNLAKEKINPETNQSRVVCDWDEHH